MISNEVYKNLKFKSYGIVEPDIEKFKARIIDSSAVPTQDSTLLREKIRDIIWDKTDEYELKHKTKLSKYRVLEINCRIPSDTAKKAITGKYNITRNFLAKFVVGLKLGIEEANELFYLESGKLNLTNSFDYIIYHALEDKDLIDFFIEEVEKYTKIKLDFDKQ